jgi:ADP-ribose pyrophosphatase
MVLMDEAMRETIVETEQIFDGHLIKLDRHKVQLPNEKHSIREIVRHPGAVAIVALDDDNNVLLVRQFRLAANKVMLEIPAGTLEPDEEPEQCAIRELQEEAKYKPQKVKSLGGIYTAPGYTTEFIHLFLATDLVQASLKPDDDEFIEVLRIPIADTLAMIDDGRIDDGKTVAGLLRAYRHLGL